jgi:short subunit dehydrogenase-like uncharacterized protein
VLHPTPLKERLTSLLAGFDVVVDAAGPFQRLDYRLAQAALAAGAHYLDIAEDAAWLAGFPAAVNALAQERGRVALAGCSTTPALMAAAVVPQMWPQWCR